MYENFVFLSTLPARGATPAQKDELLELLISIHAPREGSDETLQSFLKGNYEFLSTLPARGATRRHRLQGDGNFISIHAPREGSDAGTAALEAIGQTISIHAPREGSDSGRQTTGSRLKTFLSTLPARGATVWYCPASCPRQNFYPRSPRGERPFKDYLAKRLIIFLSTLPARGAT